MGGKGEKARAMARAGPNARQASGGIGFMENSVSRILVETVVKRTLRDMKEDPERSIRNLIDRALLVSEGRFQKRFFQTAQRMLHNERSAYYPLVRSLVENVEHARLLGFGMNVGYNSCTVCAKKIRALEGAEGFNIPWSLYLEIHADRFHKNRAALRLAVGRGQGAGHLHLVFSRGRLFRRPVPADGAASGLRVRPALSAGRHGRRAGRRGGTG